MTTKKSSRAKSSKSTSTAAKKPSAAAKKASAKKPTTLARKPTEAELDKAVAAIKELHFPADAKKARWAIPRLRNALAVFDTLDYGDPHGSPRAMGDVGLIRALHLAGQTADAKHAWSETIARWNAASFEGYNWRTIAKLQGELGLELPPNQRGTSRRAWARSILLSERMDKKPNGKVPKDPQDAYQQAHAELAVESFAKAAACLDVARTDEALAGDCELLDIYIAYCTGQQEKARAAYDAQVTRRVKDSGIAMYELLAAIGVLIDSDTQSKRVLTAWKRASPGDSEWSIFAS